jgi:hypothetical protein
MGLLTRLLLLPVTGPMAGSLWVAGQIAQVVEEERSSPAAILRALREAEDRLLAGEVSEADYEVLETELLERLRHNG